jgi:hypothetical protein
MYSPLVKKGGIIAFHDIAPKGEKELGVPIFWKEIKKHFNFEEFIYDINQKDHAIGILYV